MYKIVVNLIIFSMAVDVNQVLNLLLYIKKLEILVENSF